MEDKFARIEIDGWELNDGEATPCVRIVVTPK